MPEELTPDRKKLLYRARYRGFKEADMVIGRFAEAHLGDMSETQVETFRQLLEVPDQQLYAWIIGREPAPENYRTDVLEMIQGFDVAATILEDAGA